MYIRRKVFSYSEPEEQLYSVTMTEDEYDLFSDFMDGYYDALYEDLYSDASDVESGRDIGQLAGGALGAGAAGAGTYAYLHGMEGRGQRALDKANRAKLAAQRAKEVNAAKRNIELNKLRQMSADEWTVFKADHGLSKNLTKAEYLKADGDYLKSIAKAEKAEQKAIDEAIKAGKKAAHKARFGQYLNGKDYKFLGKKFKVGVGGGKKLLGGAAAAAALAGMGAGAALGRPIGGAVNRRHND